MGSECSMDTQWVSFESDEHILELVIMVAQHYERTKMHGTVHLKMVKNNEFYLKQNRKKNPKFFQNVYFQVPQLRNLKKFNTELSGCYDCKSLQRFFPRGTW